VGLGGQSKDRPCFEGLWLCDYGLRHATLEGPMLVAQKCKNAIAHFSDWIIAHVHVASPWLGNGFLTFADDLLVFLKCSRPRFALLTTGQFSLLGLGRLGINFMLFQVVAGLYTGLMVEKNLIRRNFGYGNFLETVNENYPHVLMRALKAPVHYWCDSP